MAEFKNSGSSSMLRVSIWGVTACRIQLHTNGHHEHNFFISIGRGINCNYWIHPYLLTLFLISTIGWYCIFLLCSIYLEGWSLIFHWNDYNLIFFYVGVTKFFPLNFFVWFFEYLYFGYKWIKTVLNLVKLFARLGVPRWLKLKFLSKKVKIWQIEICLYSKHMRIRVRKIWNSRPSKATESTVTIFLFF